MTTQATQARKTAPKEPMYFSPEADKSAYRLHFTQAGGVFEMVDTAGCWQAERLRSAWRFPDGSLFISDWAA